MINGKQEQMECYFIGGCSFAGGLFERDAEGNLWGKDFTPAFWRQMVPLIYASNVLDYTYIELNKFRILDKTLTNQKVRVYFRGLSKQEELIFGRTLPAEVLVKMRVLEAERDVYRNRFTELLKITNASSYEELRKDLLSKEVSLSKKIMGGNQYNQGGQQPPKTN